MVLRVQLFTRMAEMRVRVLFAAEYSIEASSNLGEDGLHGALGREGASGKSVSDIKEQKETQRAGSNTKSRIAKNERLQVSTAGAEDDY
jgi:hypothetical protein